MKFKKTLHKNLPFSTPNHPVNRYFIDYQYSFFMQKQPYS